MPKLMYSSRLILLLGLPVALFLGLSACESDSTSDPVSPPPPPVTDDTPRVPAAWDGLWAIRSDLAARGPGVIPPTFLVMVSGDELTRTLSRMGETVLPRDFVPTKAPVVSGTWDATAITATILEVGLIGSCASTRTTTVILTRNGTSFAGRVAVSEFVDEPTLRGCSAENARFADVEGVFVRSAPRTSCEGNAAIVPAAWAGIWGATNFTPDFGPCSGNQARGSILVFCEGEDMAEELFGVPRDALVEICTEITDTTIDATAIIQLAEDESQFQRFRLDRNDLTGTFAEWQLSQIGEVPFCEGLSFDLVLANPDCTAPVSRGGDGR